MKVFTIGRSESCDITVIGEGVSREHAQLIIDGERAEIIDLNSTNGTFVNGKKLNSSTLLISGDILLIGAQKLRWEEYLNVVSGIDHEPGIIQPIVEHSKRFKISHFIIIAIILLVLINVLFIFYNYGEETSNKKELVSDKTKSGDYTSIDTEVENKNTIENEDGSSSGLPELGKPSNKTLEPGSIDYDFSCLSEFDETGTTEVISVLGEIEDGMVGAFGEEITVKEEMEFGREMAKDIKYSDFGKDYLKIKKILNRLVTSLPKSSKYKYHIHLVPEKELNAFTCGAQIFVYQGIIDFCHSEDEIAAIIAHEIAHNELGHIKKKLSQIKTTNSMFGEGLGELTSAIYLSATTSFGQKQETHCDLYGIDLAFKAGYNACEVVGVWKRMKDNDFSVEESILRSHPFSEQRSSCCQNHINLHHPKSCK